MRHWGFCLILITVVKKSRDYGPRGKSLLYYIPHIPDIPHIPHIPDIPDIPEIFDLGIFHLVVSTFRRLKPVFFQVVVLAHFPIGHWDLTLAFLKYLTLGFDLGISSQTGFFFRFFSGWWFWRIFSWWGFWRRMRRNPHPLYY